MVTTASPTIYRLATGTARHVVLTDSRTFTPAKPSGNPVGELIAYMPEPPDIEGQKDASLVVSVTGALKYTTTVTREASALHRKVSFTHIWMQDQPVTITYTYSGVLTSEKASPSTTGVAHPAMALIGEARHDALAPNDATLDLHSLELKRLIDAWGLHRHPSETVVAFEWRVFQKIHTKLHYIYINGQDHTVSRLCSQALAGSLKTDCGGYSALGLAISRYNGIPARLKIGRWAMPAQPGPNGYDADPVHVQYEFLDDASNQMWTVDLACAAGQPDSTLPNFFCAQDGQFYTMLSDPDIVVDSVYWGKQTITWCQTAAVWMTQKYADSGDKWTVASELTAK